MHRFKKIAAAAAAAGLAGFGVAAGTSGSAVAATGHATHFGAKAAVSAPADPPTYVPVAGCKLFKQTGNYQCESGPGRVQYPLWFKFTNNTDKSVTVNPTLTCKVDGSLTTFSYPAINLNATSSKIRDNLQSAARAGSPVPDYCDLSFTASDGSSPVTNLTADPDINVQAVVALPGAIYQEAGTASTGAAAAICADVKDNGLAGTVVQAWTCLRDQAQGWVYTSEHQFVHGGNCMTQGAGQTVVVENCAYNVSDNPVASQRWFKYSSSASEIFRGVNGGCLTAPSAANGTVLKVMACSGAANQLWKAPPAAPAVP